MRDLLSMLKGNPDLGVDDPQISPLYPQNIPPQGGLTKLSEHDLQQAVIDECDRRALSNPLWGMIFCVPNGQYRKGARMEPGLRPGVPDLFLAVGRHGYLGMFIELKVGNNPQSPSQRDWEEKLKAQCYYCVVIRDRLDKAIRAIEWYLEGE